MLSSKGTGDTYGNTHTGSSARHESRDNHDGRREADGTQRVPDDVAYVAADPNRPPPVRLRERGDEKRREAQPEKKDGKGDLSGCRAHVQIGKDLVERRRDHAGGHGGDELARRADDADGDFAARRPVVGVGWVIRAVPRYLLAMVSR